MELLIIDGPTGSGKSALLQYVRETRKHSFCTPKKLTTRQKRDTADEDHRFVSCIPNDDRYLKYFDVGAEYAIDISELHLSLSQKRIPVLICTDTYAIRKLKELFEAKTLFVYRHFNERTLSSLMERRGVTSQRKIAERFSELSTLSGRYSERIMLYDHVILNIGMINSLYSQFDKILEHLTEGE